MNSIRFREPVQMYRGLCPTNRGTNLGCLKMLLTRHHYLQFYLTVPIPHIPTGKVRRQLEAVMVTAMGRIRRTDRMHVASSVDLRDLRTIIIPPALLLRNL